MLFDKGCKGSFDLRAPLGVPRNKDELEAGTNTRSLAKTVTSVRSSPVHVDAPRITGQPLSRASAAAPALTS